MHSTPGLSLGVHFQMPKLIISWQGGFLYNSFDINANVGMFFFTDNLSWLKCSIAW